ncbi:MAG: DUF4339 domain-containing protein [Flavisolibacter sp.]|nr:DUF4339 domain-containing protein [Flavisolibacter sp.]
MKIWFIRHNNESLGPYTIEELKNLSVTKDDYIWKEGLADWVQAKSLSELTQLFASSAPPPFTAQNNSSHTPYSSQSPHNSYFAAAAKPKSRSRLLWISLLFILSLVTYLIYANNNSSYLAPFSSEVQKSPEELKADLAQTEKRNPLNYINGSTAHHKNLIGEMVMNGTLTNSATLAVFKDVTMQADFLSKTNSIIGSRTFVVYEVIKPGQTVPYKQKILVPKDVTDVKLTIMDATSVN